MNISLPNDAEGELLIERGLTIVVPFYDDFNRLELQFKNWRKFSQKVRDKLHIILVDDCSPNPLILPPSKLKRINFDLSIYRITTDLKWNTPGALNLGITQAPTEWVFIMDSDCLIEPDMIEKLMVELTPEQRFIYWFRRRRITNDPKKAGNKKYLPCTILFNKTMFHEIGGFDEDFTGGHNDGYGFFDNDFGYKSEEFVYTQGRVRGVKITEYMEDIVGPNVQQRTNVRATVELEINRKMYREKCLGQIPRSTDILRFEWEKLYGNN